MGDGVLVYFGYPQALQDDAKRAVRGDLELITAIAALLGELASSALVARLGPTKASPLDPRFRAESGRRLTSIPLPR